MFKIKYCEGHFIKYKIKEVNDTFVMEIVLYYRYFLLSYKRIPLTVELSEAVDKDMAMEMVGVIMNDLNKITK